MLTTFLLPVRKYLQIQLKEGKVSAGSQVKVPYVMVVRSWRLAAWHLQSAVSGLDPGAHSALFLFAVELRILTHAMVLPTSRLHPFPPVNPTQKLPHRHAQRFISDQAIL